MPRAAAVPGRHAPVTRPADVPRRPRITGRRAARPLPRGAAVLDGILHGRAWIGLVFVLLAGIVFFNVDLLQMNREIAQTEERVGTLKRENSRLRTDLARLGSSERIQRVAAERGLVLPAPGEVRYLRSNPAADARRAAARIEAGEVSPPTAGQAPPPATREAMPPVPQGLAATRQAGAQPQE